MQSRAIVQSLTVLSVGAILSGGRSLATARTRFQRLSSEKIVADPVRHPVIIAAAHRGRYNPGGLQDVASALMPTEIARPQALTRPRSDRLFLRPEYVKREYPTRDGTFDLGESRLCVFARIRLLLIGQRREANGRSVFTVQMTVFSLIQV
jgi:hypothetical protein